MYHLKKCDKNDISTMIDEYYKNIIAPMDDMWENGIIANSNFIIIKSDNDEIGFIVCDEKNVLLEFYVIDDYKLFSDDIFNFVLLELKIKKAYVSTYDMNFLNHCLDRQTKVSINSLLYRDMVQVKLENPIEKTEFFVASLNEIIEILDYHNHKVDIKEEWLEKYCRDIISRGELYLLKHRGQIIGTGELRISFSSPKFANLGVTVSKEYQGIGLGTYILTYLKNLSYTKGYKPICSTSITNIASQKAITKSGFYPYHRVLNIEF